MRPPYGNPGQDESIRNLNDPRHFDQTTSLPARSSVQAFARETASYSAPERYPELFPPPAPKFNPQLRPHEREDTYHTQRHPNEHMRDYGVRDGFVVSTGAAAMPMGTFRPAPEAAVPVRRPARIPAGYMPYTETTNMEEPTNATPRNVPRRTVAPINDMDDERSFYASASATTFAENSLTPAFAGEGAYAEEPYDLPESNLGPISRNPGQRSDSFVKNLKYGEYLSVPQGNHSIFSDNNGKPGKLPLMMGATLGVLFLILVVVWSFAF